MNHLTHQPPLPDPLPMPALPGPAAKLQPADGPGEPDDLGLKGNFNILYDGRWLIGAATMLATVIAIVYALVSPPVYEANLLIHVEVDSPNDSKNILSQVSSMFEVKQEAIAEMELLRSRMVLSHAVNHLQLYIDVRPKYFPGIGPWLAERSGELSEPGIFGRGGFAWGAEKAEVSLFDVPAAWQNREFLLTAMGKGSYRLSGGEQPLVFEGKVGLAQKWTVGNDELVLRVERLHAKAGAVFHLQRLSQFEAIEQLRRAMLVSEQGLQSGLIEVTLLGDNPQRINSILSELGRGYIRQNLARKTEEAEKALKFLDLQLPALKRQMEQSEERYNQFRNRNSSIDMREEVRMSLQQAEQARRRSRALQQKKTELLARFGADHPVVRGVERQARNVDDEIERAERRIRMLPVREQDEASLVREIKVSTDLYNALSNTAQQLSLIAVGRVSNVRLIDAPMPPERKIKPNRPVIVLLGVIIGAFAGIVLAFTRRALNGAIDDQRTIERMLGARVVYASIPRSNVEEKLSRKARAEGGHRALLAQEAPEDSAVETLRAFRTALLFAIPNLRNNIVMLSGPTRGLGKSFVTANLAAVIAASGKRVLLIDADLRNGCLQRYFGVPRKPGLTNLLAGEMAFEHAIHRGVLENLDFLPTGALTQNRAELLLHRNLAALLDAVRGEYDVVLLDPPPVLALSDALILGAHAGAVFVLARAGRTTEQEIDEAVKRLNHAGIAPQGVLFNDLSPHLVNVRQQSDKEQASQLGYSEQAP